MGLEDKRLEALARAAGLAVEWCDASGRPQHVAPDVLRRMLQALGIDCASDRQIAESRRAIAQAGKSTLITSDVGDTVIVTTEQRASTARILFEAGNYRDVRPERHGDCLLIPPIEQAGYHMLELGDERLTLAVAPKQCLRLADLAANDRLWGLAVQLYGLRRRGDGGIGDTTALALLAREAAAAGADAIALSPTHALFSAETTKYSPYSASSRWLSNPLLADPATLFGADAVEAAGEKVGLDKTRRRLESAALIDWPEAAAYKLALFRKLFDDFWACRRNDPSSDLARAFREFREAGGARLENHARFEALHAERRRIDPAHSHWRAWPAELRNPASRAVADFAASHQKEVDFHVFLQWVADHSLAMAQSEAKRHGMRIGLIADLAVGIESGGSDAWSRQADMLAGVTIGAPPDLFNPDGQNWGLTTFSPHALAREGFTSFLTTLRAGLRHAGGLRIDHAMGLSRLWLIPDGASPTEGAYLAYPSADLIRLIKLESGRHHAVIIGEDLGTVPPGFQTALTEAGIAGMDVLWFARNKNGFLPAPKWRPQAVAMTSTHDLPTVAGWWQGRDIELRASYDLLGQSANRTALLEMREKERLALWKSFQDCGAAPASVSPPADASSAVDAAIAFVAESPAPLMLLPLEDALGLEEQPNLPGTVAQHPNWRRRYPVGVTEIFRNPTVHARLGWLKHGRTR